MDAGLYAFYVGSRPPTQRKAGSLQVPDPNQASDLALMQQMQSGDESAFEALYERHQVWVYSYLLRILDEMAVAAELRQEVFLRVWRDRARWRPSGSVRGYLVRIARRLAIDEGRRRKVRMRWRDPDERRVPTPEHQLMENERASRVHAAIAALPERAREVFLLKREADLSYVEIAERLGISPKTVDVHMSRALRRLREELADLLE